MLIHPYEIRIDDTAAMIWYRPSLMQKLLDETATAELSVDAPTGTRLVDGVEMEWNAEKAHFEAELDTRVDGWTKAMGYTATVTVSATGATLVRHFSFAVCRDPWTPNLTTEDLAVIAPALRFEDEIDSTDWTAMIREAAEDIYLRLASHKARAALLIGASRSGLDRAHKWKTLELFYLRSMSGETTTFWIKYREYRDRRYRRRWSRR